MKWFMTFANVRACFARKGYLFLFSIYALLSGCASLPHDKPMMYSSAFAQTAHTMLGRAVESASQNHPGQSGFTPLDSGTVAFAARMALAEAAQTSLDIQYYIWHNDKIGKLFAAALLHAADRGVRVRLLLDDWGVYDADEVLAALVLHPKIHIRLFNPFKYRHLRKMETLLSFSRINRRMHNKSFTADNQITIVGGRNIGEEYFDANDDVNFSDFEVMALGPLVDEVSGAFDRYWNSEIAVPVQHLIPQAKNRDLVSLRSTLDEHYSKMQGSPYLQRISESRLVSQLLHSQVPMYWGEALVVYDEPEKVVTSIKDRDDHLVSKLHPLLSDTDEELIIISPYFIPGQEGVEQFETLIDNGLSVKVLTNSLASTDVGIVYSGYKPYIRPMLKAGVELYEARPEITNTKARKKSDKRIGSSSRSSLHTKLYVFDQRKIFVGSLNLDPRSTVLNTELGIIFINDEFGQLIAQEFNKQIHQNSYQLRLTGKQMNPKEEQFDDDINQLIWLEHSDNGIIEHKVEPHVGFWRRLGVDLLRLLPIENQL